MSWAETMLMFLLFALSIPPFFQAWSVDYPSPIANVPSHWTNNNATIPYNATYADGSTIRAILVRQNPVGYAPSFASGFICAAPCDGAFLFAVFSVSIGGSSTSAPANATAAPRVVWAANRHRPVKENASVQLTEDGNLILRDFDGSLVWSTNTLHGPVVGVNLADTGNLILFDVMGKTAWESFEHPTDTLLIGQSLRQGKRLTSASSNLAQGQFYLTVLEHGIYAFVDADTPQSYYQKRFNITDATVQSKMNISSDEPKNGTAYISLLRGSLSAFLSLSNTSIKLFNMSLPWPSSAQLMSLEDDGHLRLYGWNGLSWKSLADVLNVDPEDCAYPTVCGEYGICSEGQCTCPAEKADIYSFGVVVLEIVSRRKILDDTKPEGSTNLINLLQEKIKIGQVLDIVENQNEDVQLHRAEMIEVIKLAVWCLQRECTKRPAMSQVVKILESAMDTEASSETTSRDDICDASSPLSPVPVSAR
ncbi:hypothetical protein ZWY2020_013405 [Hordeum vulgare]|nr:hypothetical protein ZWY2020_013405 [Hordeum vulgare]